MYKPVAHEMVMHEMYKPDHTVVTLETFFQGLIIANIFAHFEDIGIFEFAASPINNKI